MRPFSIIVPLMLLAVLAAPAPSHAQTVPNYWFTLSGSASSANDSFGEFAQTGMLFLGGAHRRVGDHVTLGLEMGAHHWPGEGDLSFDGVQVSLDGRFHLTRPSSRMRPFVQAGVGSYQMVSNAEPPDAEPRRASETSFGVNVGGGVLFAVGASARLGPVLLYHSAGQIPDLGAFTSPGGDLKFLTLGLEFVMPMGR